MSYVKRRSRHLCSKRFKIKDDVIDGQVFINPGMVVGLVIMPISSKVVLAATKTEFAPDQVTELTSFQKKHYSATISTFFDNAIIEVACENRDYLKHFINLT